MDDSTKGTWERIRAGNFSMGEVTAHYNNYSRYYDEYHVENRYRGPEYTAEAVGKYFGSRPDVKIIEPAAGTGLLGEKLKERGFCNIDAMDPSKDMKVKAMEKNIYNNYFLEPLTENPTPIPDDTYDGVVMVGGIVGCLIPCRAMLEIIRITKPGGLFINTTSKCHFDDALKFGYRLEPYMQELEERGKWRLIEKRVLSEYHSTFCANGIMHVFEINESGVSDFESSVL